MLDYSKLSNTYEDTRKIEPLVFNLLQYEVKKNMTKKILDFGCGTGNYLFELNKNFDDIELFGVDVSPSMAKIAKNKNPSANIFIGNHCHTPFDSDSFDFIYVIDVIHQLQSIDVLLQELHRILNRNGVLCIATESEAQLKRKYWNKYFPEAFYVDKRRFHDISYIISFAKEIGYSSYKNTAIEEMSVGTIPKGFIKVAQHKGLSIFHLISDESYETGLKMLMKDFNDGVVVEYNVAKTLLWFKKENTFDSDIYPYY